MSQGCVRLRGHMLSTWHSAWKKSAHKSTNNCLRYNFFLLFSSSPLYPRPPGLRKLEAFFAFLIAIMAFTFGYEVGSLKPTLSPMPSYPVPLSPQSRKGGGWQTLATPLSGLGPRG